MDMIAMIQTAQTPLALWLMIRKLNCKRLYIFFATTVRKFSRHGFLLIVRMMSYLKN